MNCGLLFLSLCVSVLRGWQMEDGVMLLNDDNWDLALGSYKELLVEFYAPWCGHCKKLAPVYAEAAVILARHNPPLFIGKIDATANPISAAKYSIDGYPTLKFFLNKTPVDFTGSKTADGIATWVQTRVDSPVEIYNALSDLEATLARNLVTAVLFAQKDSQEFAEFETVARTYDETMFILVTFKEGREKFGVQEPTLIVNRVSDNQRVIFTGPFRAARIEDFISKNRLPWVTPFGDIVVRHVFKDHNPILLALYPLASVYYRAVLDAIAPDVKDSIRMSYADLENEDGYKLADFLGIPTNSPPTAIILDWFQDSLVKYKFTEAALNKETLKEFINLWTTGELVPFYKSEKTPENNPEELVKSLVGSTFEDVVRSEKDVLVLFYAPWSNKSKSLLLEYETVAKKYETRSTILIAKIDATANDVKGHSFVRYPVLKLFGAKNTAPITYTGGLNALEIIAFLDQNATPETARKEGL